MVSRYLSRHRSRIQAANLLITPSLKGISMTIKTLTTNDLVRVASAGGGLKISARSLTLDDMVRVAFAASSKGARIIIEDAQVLTADQMVRIGFAGKGCASFE